MRTIEVSDELYEQLANAAAEDGQSIEELLAEVADVPTAMDLVQRHFTTEKIAEWRQTADEMEKGGASLSIDEAWANLEIHRTALKAPRA